MSKNIVRNFIISPEQDDKLKALAKVMGLSLSAVVRSMIDDAIPAENLAKPWRKEDPIPEQGTGLIVVPPPDPSVSLEDFIKKVEGEV